MMKKKKQSGAKGHKPKGGGKGTVSRRPKPSAPPQDTDVNVGSGGSGFHDHTITWHNPGTVDETVDFYTAKGSPFVDPNNKSFVVPKNGGIKKTVIRHDALGEYTYRTSPPLPIGPHGGGGGDPTVIIQ